MLGYINVTRYLLCFCRNYTGGDEVIVEDIAAVRGMESWRKEIPDILGEATVKLSAPKTV